ncbi:MAG: ABC transporter ATP-binding protein [Nitrososphaerota archaeon]
MAAIEAINLTKRYGEITAVDNLNLSIEEGEIFGFLGPNGSGKTTTILMFMGLTEPTSGEAKVFNLNPLKDALKVRRIVSYLPENIGFYEDLTAKQNLEYVAKLNGIPSNIYSKRIRELLEIVGLSQEMDRKVGEYSRGMKQRLGIAEVLLKDPKLIFLDEPTLGLDPEATELVLNLIEKINKEKGITIFLSSHLLHQVQRVCKRVGIFVKGKLLAEGTIDRLGKERLKEDFFTIEVKVLEKGEEALEIIKKIDEVKNVEMKDDLLIIKAESDIRPKIAKRLIEENFSILHLRLREYTLDEIYKQYFEVK